MPKLPIISGKGLVKFFLKLNYEEDHQTGGHMIFKHPDGRKTSIPHHSGEEIGPGLLNKIIKKDLRITREEFLKYK